MVELPPALARHFRTPTGRTDYRALVRAPDGRLVALARELSADERVRLYHRLRYHRPGFFEGIAAAAAGVDVEAQRRRLLRVLEVAHVEAAEAEAVGV